jgi:hypothetical protein
LLKGTVFIFAFCFSTLPFAKGGVPNGRGGYPYFLAVGIVSVFLSPSATLVARPPC